MAYSNGGGSTYTIEYGRLDDKDFASSFYLYIESFFVIVIMIMYFAF